MLKLLKKSYLLTKTLIHHPADFPYRLVNIVEARLSTNRKTAYHSLSLADGIVACSRHFGVDFSRYRHETGLREIEQAIAARLDAIRPQAPFDTVYNVDDTMATLLYLTVRALQPEVIVETGVAYGNSSAHILKALSVNGHGKLISIDLAPLAAGAEDFIGALIPNELKSRWTLYQGSSRRLLPGVLEALGRVDMFIHDSLHTYSNMRFEYQTITPYLHGNAILFSDDIDQNPAFADWQREHQPAFAIAIDHVGKANTVTPGLMGLASQR